MILRSIVTGSLWVAALQPAPLLAAADEFDSLLRNNPFGRATSGTAAAGPRTDSTTPLEFRGVMVDRGEQFFSVHEIASRASMWVGINEAGNPYKVQAYDSAKGILTVEFQGRTLSLPLKQARVVAMSGPVPGSPVQGPFTMNPTDPAAGIPAGRSPEESARLATIAEEIRRRRALRQQATPPNVPVPANKPKTN